MPNPSTRFCPSYLYFTGLDDAKEGFTDFACLPGEENEEIQ